MVTGACPDEDQLVRMVEGALGDVSLATLEAHIDGCERCASVVAGLASFAPKGGSRQFGRYQLDRMIAAGGMGEVWAGWDPELRREVAIKIVRPDRADDERERARLKREARSLAMLTHPNVLAVFDVGEVDGELFLATELVNGATLASHGGASSDWRAITALYVQAARGLAAAHAVGLVHRDVKPHNLLLGADGRVRVADFGLAIRGITPAVISPVAPTETAPPGGEPSITRTGHIAGTPAYMAPEQRPGVPADARTDQYALCVALVEAISGRRPTGELDARELIAFVAERRAREPALDALCWLLARGLAHDPKARFPDMTELANRIEEVIAPASSPRAVPPPVVAKPAPTPVSTTGRRRTRAAIAAIVVIGGGAATTLWFGLRPAPSSAPAQVAPPPAQHAVVTPIVMPDAAPAVASADADVAPIAAAPPPRAQPPSHVTRPAPAKVTNLGDVSTLFMRAQSASDSHDAATCLSALAQMPANIDPRLASALDVLRGQCMMIEGRCDEGFALVVKSYEATGMASSADQQATVLARDYCPIAGSLQERLLRLQQQTMRHVDHPAWCATMLAPARQAASEATTPYEKSLAAIGLRGVARCRSYSGHCDEAIALMAQAEQIEPTGHKRDREINAKCLGETPGAPQAP